MKKSLLLILSLVVIIVIIVVVIYKKDRIDVTDTGFRYNIEVCNNYYELVECVIDRTDNEVWTDDIKNELRLEIKKKQEERKDLSKEQLIKNCTEMLDSLKENASDLNDLGCSVN